MPYVSPFGTASLFEQKDKGYVKYVDFEKLLAAISNTKGRSLRYRYRDFESNATIPFNEPWMQDVTNEYEWFRKMVEKATPLRLPETPRERIDVVYKDKDTKEVLAVSGLLNVEDGIVPIKKGYVRSMFILDVKARQVQYVDGYLYLDFEKREPGYQSAFLIFTNRYDHYFKLGEITGMGLSADMGEYIEQKLTAALKNAQKDADSLAWLYANLPDFVLQKRTNALLIDDLTTLLKEAVNEGGDNRIDEEAIVLAIISRFSSGHKEDHDFLLKALCTRFVEGQSLMETLWSRMNDFGGAANFTATVQALYKLWLGSSYAKANNPAYKYNGEPETIAYQSKKILGFYESSYSFDFDKATIKVSKKETKVIPSSAGATVSTRYKPFATYHMFQPIQLPSVQQDGEIKLPDTLIPAFYLKAFDDKGVWKNFETTVWLTLDVVTTASGIGNLLKLRHLLKLRTLGAFIRILNGTVQVASGVVGTLLNFVNDCSEGTFCQKLRNYLFWLDLATFGVDAITEHMLRKSAKEALDAADGKVSQEIKEHLEKMADAAYVNRGRYLGQALEAADLTKLESYLLRYKVKLHIGPTDGAFEVPGFFYPSGRVFTMEPKNAALFITDGTKMTLALREGGTLYDTLHELMHFRHSQKLGLKRYYALGKLKDGQGTIIRERFVYDKMVAYKDFLNREEMIHVRDYMNFYYKRFGVIGEDGSPYKVILPFIVESIPKKRKGLSINKILNLK